MTTYQTGVLPLPWSMDSKKIKVIKALEKAGCTVVLENTGDQYIVKIREDGHRQIRTGSTSGYPIEHAFDKWQERHGATL